MSNNSIFPRSGVPAAQANRAYVPTITPVSGCDPKFYPTGNCQTRIDGEALNAVMSQILCVLDRAEIAYDCNSLCQLADAIFPETPEATGHFRAHISSDVAAFNGVLTVATGLTLDEALPSWAAFNGPTGEVTITADGVYCISLHAAVRFNYSGIEDDYGHFYFVQANGLTIMDQVMPGIVQAGQGGNTTLTTNMTTTRLLTAGTVLRTAAYVVYNAGTSLIEPSYIAATAWALNVARVSR